MPNAAIRVKRQASAGDGEVRDVAQVAVEAGRDRRRHAGVHLDRAAGAFLVARRADELLGADRGAGLAREGPDHAERGMVDPHRAQAGGAEGVHDSLDHVAAGGHGHHVDPALAVLPL